MNLAIENAIRRHPEQWLWLHRRWKPFAGTSRWSLPGIVLGLSLGWLALSGCSSSQVGRTGIEIPPDPRVAVPQFENVAEKKPVESPEAENLNLLEHAQKMGIAVDSEAASAETEAPKSRAKAKNVGKRTRNEKNKTQKPVAAVGPETNPLPPAFTKIPRDKIPFQVGERLELDLTWLALPAGRAVLEVRKGPLMNGRETFHFWGNVLSSRLVDTIYHVDNSIESYVDLEGFIPYKFLLSMVESAQLKETRVVFDHVKQKAFYWSKRVSERWGNEVIDVQDNFIVGARDVFTALYYTRVLDYALNQTYRIPMYEKGKNMEIKLTPVKNELVNTKVGVFQAWKIAVQLYMNNVLNQTGATYMWLTDDANRYLIKFDAQIKIGSLKGMLVELRER